MRRCVEAAVAANISLQCADLENANLANAMLDGADLRYASLRDANLTGANLSEARLDGADLRGAVMHGTILCYSSLVKCRLEDVSFGATEITGTVLDHCRFSTLSAFDLEFTMCESMKKAHFINPCGTPCPINRPPIVIQGLRTPIIIMDRHFKKGHQVYTLQDLPSVQRGLRLRLEQVVATIAVKT